MTLAPTQATLRPNGPAQAFTARIFEQPAGTPVSFRAWSLTPSSRYTWEVVGLPQGADGGHFVFASAGSLKDADTSQMIDPTGFYMQQLYYSPPALPQGTTRLELKIRLTVNPPQGTPLAVGDASITVDANAPATPSAVNFQSGQEAGPQGP
ncbi:MAG: hypothetical protein U0P81_06675 [Holophagaceae bacterium]